MVRLPGWRRVPKRRQLGCDRAQATGLVGPRVAATTMPTVIQFILGQRPPDTHMIVATHDRYGFTEQDAAIIAVGKPKDQLLDEESYDEVSGIVRPYLGQLIQSEPD